MRSTLKKLAVITSLVAAALLVVPASAMAVPPRAKTNARLVNQNARINQGVRSGQVTRAERVVLKAEQRKINRTKKRFIKNDGKIGKAEKAKLNRMQNRSSRHIYRAKHNKRTR